ncbi:SET domain-containing protein [Penicillium ucsense]|uniref:SET domain-containing protein n=1 Tax=Penicillium ucsense TaxID=2839758 RepID=A0A8J8W6G1_9EURO|nr:SET domain-containing protein [Penicillium ucsense]KAF7734131.1 SET domain-containing protein [Penicillium ucsense]
MDADELLAAMLDEDFNRPDLDSEYCFAQNAQSRSRRIIAAIYWDLNAMWQLQKIWRDPQSPDEERAKYVAERRAIEEFLDQSMYHKYPQIFQTNGHYPLFDRVRFFLFEHGWPLFAMCALSEAFRAACLIPEIMVWDEVRKLISTNKRSIEVYVRSRNLDWQSPLLNYGHLGLPGLTSPVQPEMDLGKEHVHHLVQTSDGHLKRPVHMGKAQTNINITIFKPAQSAQKTRTTRMTRTSQKIQTTLTPQTTQETRKTQTSQMAQKARNPQRHPYTYLPKWGPCMKCLCKRKCPCHNVGGLPDCLKCQCPQACTCKKPKRLICYRCGSTDSCTCRAGSMAGDLIELVEYPIKGTGVRALANFLAGTIMGEYVGEAIPLRRKCNDNIYALSQTGVYGMEQMDQVDIKHIGITSSAHLGNWTRYINHHCEPNCTFVSVLVGDRITTVVQAVRDIAIFEEITLHYGEQYWNSRHCLCGSSKCCNPPP